MEMISIILSAIVGLFSFFVYHKANVKIKNNEANKGEIDNLLEIIEALRKEVDRQKVQLREMQEEIDELKGKKKDLSAQIEIYEQELENYKEAGKEIHKCSFCRDLTDCLAYRKFYELIR